MKAPARLKRRKGLQPGQPMARTELRPVSRKRAAENRERGQRWAAPARDTGFSAKVKLAVRTRAGNGEAADASCEACGRFLGLRGGQVHHRIDRGMGGSRLRNGIQNASLLCGVPNDYTTCHGKATRGDAHMRAQGFVLDTGQNPAAESILLHGLDRGDQMWLTADGGYSPKPPGGAS